jgi:hypothetical protein
MRAQQKWVINNISDPEALNFYVDDTQKVQKYQIWERAKLEFLDQ